MYLVQPYPAHRGQVLVVINGTSARVQNRHAAHLFVAEREVEDVQVLRHALLAHALGDDYHAALVEPPQDYLPRGLAVAVGYGLDGGVAEYASLALGEGCPGLMLYALLAQEGVGRALLEEGMRLKLVHHRLHRVVQEEVLQAFAGEARHADGAHPALLIQPLHGAPRGVIIAVRLVQKVQVEVIKAEVLHRQVEGAQRVVILVVLNPELGRHEHLLARQPAAAQGVAHLFFIEI